MSASRGDPSHAEALLPPAADSVTGATAPHAAGYAHHDAMQLAPASVPGGDSLGHALDQIGVGHLYIPPNATTQAELDTVLGPFIQRGTGTGAYMTKAFVSALCCVPCCCSEMFTVRANELVYALVEGSPVLFGPGMHLKMLHPGIEFPRTPHTNQMLKYDVNKPAEEFKTGIITIVTVARDKVGLLLNAETGTFNLLRPGRHAFVDANLVYQGSADANAKLIKLGDIHIFQVQPGEAFAVYQGRRIEILNEGVHCLVSANIRILSPGDDIHMPWELKEKVLPLPMVETTQKSSVVVRLDPVIRYTITELGKLVTQSHYHKLEDKLREIVVAVINEVAERSSQEISDSDLDLSKQRGEGVSFVSRSDVCEKGTQEAQSRLRDWGIRIIIESKELKYDERTLDALGRQFQAEQTLKAARVDLERAKVDAEAKAVVIRTLAEARAEEIRIVADAEIEKAGQDNFRTAYSARARAPLAHPQSLPDSLKVLTLNYGQDGGGRGSNSARGLDARMIEDEALAHAGGRGR